MSYFPCDNGIDICRITNLPCSECAPVCAHKKPPIGLMPKKIYDHKRMVDIFDAMKRYSEAEKVIPIEWIDELKELAINMGRMLNG